MTGLKTRGSPRSEYAELDIAHLESIISDSAVSGNVMHT